MKVYTIHPGGKKRMFAPCTEKDPQAIIEWLKEADTSHGQTEEFLIVVGEMEEAEYDKLPEYMGP